MLYANNTSVLYSRYITKEELEQALKAQGLYDGREIKDIISDADADNVSELHILLFKCLDFMLSLDSLEDTIIYPQDGRINYEEFVAMMRQGNPEPNNPKKRRDVFIS